VLAAVALALLLIAPAPGAGDPPASAAGVEQALQQGDAAWRQRGDPEQLAVCIAGYSAAAAERPGDPTVELRLARAYAFRALSDPAAAETAWLESSRAAERALRSLAPRWAQAIDRGGDAGEAAALVEAAGAEALYRWALGAMGLARQRGFTALLFARGAVRGSLERAAALDGSLDCAGPWRALGGWLAVLPSAAGGGSVASRAAFQRARALGPRCMLTAVHEAETLAVLRQDRAQFERLLREALSFDPALAPEWSPENLLARRLARALLDRTDRLF
jgi:hypothetical protein